MLDKTSTEASTPLVFSSMFQYYNNESTAGTDASVKALTFACGAIEWEMIEIIVAKKDVKSSKSINAFFSLLQLPIASVLVQN